VETEQRNRSLIYLLEHRNNFQKVTKFISVDFLDNLKIFTTDRFHVSTKAVDETTIKQCADV
jgi:hypothetical protein